MYILICFGLTKRTVLLLLFVMVENLKNALDTNNEKEIMEHLHRFYRRAARLRRGRPGVGGARQNHRPAHLGGGQAVPAAAGGGSALLFLEAGVPRGYAGVCGVGRERNKIAEK